VPTSSKVKLPAGCAGSSVRTNDRPFAFVSLTLSLRHSAIAPPPPPPPPAAAGGRVQAQSLTSSWLEEHVTVEARSSAQPFPPHQAQPQPAQYGACEQSAPPEI
jgi:hypothetical protein